MTSDHDIERVLDRWFTEGPTRMPERFLDDTLGRIDRSRRPGLAGLRRGARSVDVRVWLGIAAAVVLAVAAIGGGTLLRDGPDGPAAVGSGAVPADLRAEWRPVGPRQHPTLNGETIPLDLDIVIDVSTITIFEFKGDVVSAASLAGADRLDLRTLNDPTVTVPGPRGSQSVRSYWGCAVGDEATYVYQLSSDRLALTLTPVSDACAARAAILAGDWFRTDNGALAPGRHEATLFRPFDGGTSGRFSFTVPTGWSVAGEQLSGETSFDLAGVNGFKPGAPQLLVLANALPTTPQLDCGRNSDVAVEATPSGYARWLAGRQGLVVTAPTLITVGGLDGTMVDVSIDPVAATACGGIVETFYAAVERPRQAYEAVGPSLPVEGDQRMRYYLLDSGPGVVLLIAIEVPDQAAWDAAIADATPVIESFEFAR